LITRCTRPDTGSIEYRGTGDEFRYTKFIGWESGESFNLRP
jgi:hypothetical protein